MKHILLILLLALSTQATAEWVKFSTRSNGDVYFYDNARVEISGDETKVWTRILYKTSVMAASSYQSLVRLNCLDNSETILQNTFFTDREWSKPAMATNTNAKPTQDVAEGSASQQLIDILCNR